jgi:hypothetical protein
LYYVSDPATILSHSVEAVRVGGFLIVHTVVSQLLDIDLPFIAPAPGWDWGCRFSSEWLMSWVHSREDLRLISSTSGILPYNKSRHDRGFAAFLAKKVDPS